MFPQIEITEVQTPAAVRLAEDAAHADFRSQYLAVLKPTGAIELNLADGIAENAWRLRRIRLAEEKMLSTAETGVEAFLMNAKQFQMLALYEQRVQRLLERNINLLRKLRADRLRNESRAFEEAKVLAQQSYLKDKPYDPAWDFPPERGFTFTSADVNASIRRDHRVREAKHNDRVNFEPGLRRDRYQLNIIDNPVPGEPISYDPTLVTGPRLFFDPTRGFDLAA